MGHPSMWISVEPDRCRTWSVWNRVSDPVQPSPSRQIVACVKTALPRPSDRGTTGQHQQQRDELLILLAQENGDQT